MPEIEFCPKGFAPFQTAKEFSSKPTSSPAMTNRPDLHLLPRGGHKKGARRTSSRGRRCLPEIEFCPKGFAPFQTAKEFSSKPTSSPAM
ncbi:hypothetical protein, partial [Mesorhizobium sp. M7A.F.Ca.US.005.03.2.1]|uniref:hypothetical protein n=1 Tax=Mesorhizobium sp. M7A.F.Ca.US.005.03.2.1 TaxID=2496737 RepID=UPI0019D203DF